MDDYAYPSVVAVASMLTTYIIAGRTSYPWLAFAVLVLGMFVALYIATSIAGERQGPTP